ncbi:MAG: ABC transporter ATP-binding protein/permease [Cyclobacteriaceae bacterium]|nr:ABC transporter ATP-binding protein [Cyclobacteriaceae bacterium]MCB0500099.1 ABC transporter ATP-binding protein [Cyclobacteriaceae bacterium]MCB9239299.1 ABC transporter ATP-binding protein [Flammeovirgaceae bacterium]MCO5271387.1 ABC transporter ATP-binding protein/permease [Cyclobacteriaceae bacterium]MCW5903825.1 ABC transporter ATP-binding protein [Cyclobacteriaceae bacterium]
MPEKKHKISMAQVFKTIVWPRRKLLLLGFVLIIVSRASSVVLPYSVKPIIDDVIGKGDFSNLKLILVGVSASILISAIVSYALTILLSVEAQYLISVLRANVQKHLLRLPTRFFDNQQTGKLVSRVMTDVEGVRNLVGTGFLQLIGGVLMAVICLFFLISISWKLTLFTLVPLSLFGVVSMKAFGKIRPIFRERGAITAEVTGRLTQTFGGIRVIKGFNAAQQEAVVFEKGVERIFQNVKSSLTTTSMVTSLGSFLFGMALVGIIGIGGYMLTEKTLTAGELTQFAFFLGFLIAPIFQMSNIGSQLTEAFAGLDRTEELMNTEVEDDATVRTVKIGEIKGDIEFDKVSFAYEEGKRVLKEVSFVAPSGSMTALVGTSGSGKSTIAGLAASFLVPQEGTITVDGHDLSKVSLDSYRGQLGVVLQDDFLFDGTIRENILFARPAATESELQAAIAGAYVSEFSDKFEKGLDTVIGERGIKLSGGQRQRVTIARAILANPRVLILDEATSSLDTESEALIQDSLKQLLKGRTTFVIAHRLSTIRQADQILVIEQGQIAERGKHDELIGKKGRYYELYTYQARI